MFSSYTVRNCKNFSIYLHENAFRIIVYFSYIQLEAGHSFTTAYADRQTAGHWKVNSGFIQALLMVRFNHGLLGDKVILVSWWRLVEASDRLCPDKTSEVMSTEENGVILSCLPVWSLVYSCPSFLFEPLIGRLVRIIVLITGLVTKIFQRQK